MEASKSYHHEVLYHQTYKGEQEPVRIFVMDDPGPGGAHHEYEVTVGGKLFFINFQKGGVLEAGENGLTVEALLAICMDRLICFQAGPFPCKENQEALGYIQEAMGLLLDRTRARRARGVEGIQEA